MRSWPALLTIALVACTHGAPSPAVATQNTLPRARIVTLSGEESDLGTFTAGSVALVSFWATWCEACLKEMDALNRLAAKTSAQRTTGGANAIVLGVAVGESPETVDAFVRLHGLVYAQLVDEEYRLADALGQRNVPATLVLDRGGHIVYRGEALDHKSLEAFREALRGTP